MSIHPVVAAPARAHCVIERLAAVPAGLAAADFAWIERDGTAWWGFGEAWRLEAADDAEAIALPDRCRELLQAIDCADPKWLRAFGGLAFPTGGGLARFWIPAALVRIAGDTIELGLIQPGDAIRERITRPVAATWQPGSPEPAPDARAHWEAGIAEAVSAIRAGQLQKVVRARTIAVRFPTPVDPMAILQKLAPRAPQTDRFCFRFSPEEAFLAASPELLFAQTMGMVHADCLAGTAPRGADPAEDDALGRALLASAKDRHEQALVVDAVRRALAPLTHDLEVPAEPALRKLPSVQHLFTPVAGPLRPNVRLADLLAALYPTPAVCGTPRQAARDWIAASEPPRGWYAGAIGWVGLQDAYFAVGIRAASVRGDRVHVHVGAGIVADSQPAAEWEETQRKGQPLLKLLTEAPA